MANLVPFLHYALPTAFSASMRRALDGLGKQARSSHP
jgi:hypothetical protein